MGFIKALKIIVLGGVDPSVRAKVWEFLLGCYALSNIAEYRQHLRMARRERYRELIEQCQMMHSSIGTGSLAYTIGSKVMDVRIMSKDSAKKQAKLGVKRITEEAKSKLESSHGLQPNERFEVSYANENDRPSSSDSHDFGSARENPDDAALNSFYSISSTGLDSGVVSESEREDNGRIYSRQDSSDFPPLPVTNLFERDENAGEGSSESEAISPREQAMGNSYNSSHINSEKGDIPLEDAIHKFENVDKIVVGNVELAQENHINSSKDIRIPLVSFTGSTKVGQIVQRTVHARFGKCLLELSGNNAIIVMDDASLALRFQMVPLVINSLE